MSMRDEFEEWFEGSRFARAKVSTKEAMYAAWQAAREQGAEPVFWWDGDLSDLDGCVSNSQSAYHTIPLYTQPQSAGVPEGWDIERESGDRITLSADGLGFYVARMDAERIADIMLYALANDLLAAPQPPREQEQK